MSDDITNGGAVRYTMKELLAEIRGGIVEIKTTLASHERRLEKLEGRVDKQERITTENLPVLHRLVRDLDVQRDVAAALDARSDKGFTRRQKQLGLAFLAVSTTINALSLGPDFF